MANPTEQSPAASDPVREARDALRRAAPEPPAAYLYERSL